MIINSDDKVVIYQFVKDNAGKNGYVNNEIYKKIYMEFINRQNKSLESLLNEKISTGIFNSKSKNRISVQKIKDSEIFTSENIDETFTNIIFNSSYRKYINTQ